MVSIQKIGENKRLALLDLHAFSLSKGLITRRELERGGFRHLLKELFGREIEPQYTPEGKPFLNSENCHISLSHSHDMLAVIVNSEEATGVDIELIRDKVLKIKHKFLSEKELKFAGENVEKLIVYWACKEALYKLYGMKEVDFIENLHVEDLVLKEKGEISAEIGLQHFHKKYRLHYEKLKDYMLVYVLNEVK